jgi:hypothetical protein
VCGKFRGGKWNFVLELINGFGVQFKKSSTKFFKFATFEHELINGEMKFIFLGNPAGKIPVRLVRKLNNPGMG